MGAGFELRADIAKVDDGRRLVFGWGNVTTVGGRLVKDLQDDVIPTDELEDAAYRFVLNVREAGDVHMRRTGIGKLVESVFFSAEKQRAIGIDLGFEAWWLGFRIDDDTVWAKVRSGTYKSFSIGGSAAASYADAAEVIR
jgi:hypothetical protein